MLRLTRSLIECKSNGNFIKDEYTHTLRLESELSDLRVGYANPYRAKLKFAELANHSNEMLDMQSASGFDHDEVAA